MRIVHRVRVGIVLILCLMTPAIAEESCVTVGAGSITTELPAGGKAPQSTIYKTENVKGPTPTNRWWSSLVWEKFSSAQYPHPLAVKAVPAGLRVYYPGPAIAFTRDGVIAPMPDRKEDDFVLGLSTTHEFADARVDGFSDWFVRARFADASKNLTVTYGHGSPFIYALCTGGSPRVTFDEAPKVWSGDAHSPALGITVHGKPYALFGPTGSTWQGLGTSEIVNSSEGKPYFSVALLPEGDEKTLKLFAKYAYNHVTDSKVTWHYDAATSGVSCDFAVTTRSYEGSSAGTLLALYPHQWRHCEATFVEGSYASVRGTMKLVEGPGFTTHMTYPGVLPALPRGANDASLIATFLKAETVTDDPTVHDTYADGKKLGREADEAAIADQFGSDEPAAKLRERMRIRFEAWFTARTGDGQTKAKQLFYRDADWGTIIGYPAAYGSDVEMNDHHFHYGYFIRAAAELARRDPAWASDAKYGAMVKLLIRDIANPRRDDPELPFLRNFDPYAGHSWASGHARFGDGNNEESSSEAINAWYGVILWGAATHNDALRDLGIWLYTTETTAAREYWLNVNADDFGPKPAGTPPIWLAMIWGGKGVSGTWFSGKFEPRHAINWMPIHGGSLYLGLDDGGTRNYESLVAEKHGTSWEQWSDLIWMYRGLSDSADAMKQYEADGGRTAPEQGNSRANLYHWLTCLQQYGAVDPTVTADDPLFAVFRKGSVRTYAAYNSAGQPITVHFTDGHSLQVPANALACETGK
jgi:endoglucanase Acf2